MSRVNNGRAYTLPMLMVSALVAGILPTPLSHIFRPVLLRIARNTTIEPTFEG
jgi:hypothetical protein